MFRTRREVCELFVRSASASHGAFRAPVGNPQRRPAYRASLLLLCVLQTRLCPVDSLLQIGSGQTSVGVRALLARFYSYLPPRIAAMELEMVCGVRLSHTTVHRQAQAVGEQLQKECTDKEASWLVSQPLPPRHKAPQMHVSMDGVMIHVDKRWREVKLGVVYERGSRGGVERANYYATLSPSATFGRRVRMLAQSEGADYCRKLAVVADGGEWIWQECGRHFTQSVQILDFYHACEHLWEVSRARFGEESEAGKQWMKQQKDRLLTNKVRAVIADLQKWQPLKEAHKEIQRKQVNYLQTHQRRMRYETFEQQGYHIGSGVIEAGCKSVVQGRLKRAGMRWNAKGAEATLHLCAQWSSTQSQDFTDAARKSCRPV